MYSHFISYCRKDEYQHKNAAGQLGIPATQGQQQPPVAGSILVTLQSMAKYQLMSGRQNFTLGLIFGVFSQISLLEAVLLAPPG